jgi:hypothetical protein
MPGTCSVKDGKKDKEIARYNAYSWRYILGQRHTQVEATYMENSKCL